MRLKRFFAAGFLVAGLLLSPAALYGQAWTPPAGQGTVWVSTQMLHADAHLLGSGITPDIDVRATTFTLGLDYGLTDRLAFGLSLPYVSTRFDGGVPHAGSVVDSGADHRTPTDLRLDLRYKALDSIVAFTPMASVLMPTNDYDTLGHSAPGRGLREYAAGFDVGYNAVPISPSLFLSGGYRFTYVERIDDEITVDRSNAEVHADYLVTERLALRASGIWQETDGGLDLPLAPSQRREHGQHHDQLARANFWHGSVGAGYGLTPSLDLFVSWSTSLEGVNSHRFRSWSGGVSWRFDRSRLRRIRQPAASPITP